MVHLSESCLSAKETHNAGMNPQLTSRKVLAVSL